MYSQRSTPWIHRQSRFIIAAIGSLGAVITAYLTSTKLAGGSAICPTEGCEKVLESPYAVVFGLPLALFGFLAYVSMIGAAVAPWFVNAETNKAFRVNLENWTWLFMFAGGTSMMLFSAYLMYISSMVLKSFCLYCVGSAICALALFILSLIGRDWEDLGQLFFIGIIVGMITMIGTLAVYAPINNPGGNSQTENGYAITTTSSPANIELAKHLTANDIKMYGAFWCGHCHDQKQMFGQEAVRELTYIECDPNGQNPQPDLCKAANIQGYPSWEIKGQIFAGTQSLEDLAKLSGYTGQRNFGTQ